MTPCNAGHNRATLCKAACLLSELNALEASTSRTPSISFFASRSHIMWTDVSQADGIPTHVWVGATTFMTSDSTTEATARQMSLLWTSPTAIGRTPGRLSRGISRADVKPSIASLSIDSVQMHRAAAAKAEQSRSDDAL